LKAVGLHERPRRGNRRKNFQSVSDGAVAVTPHPTMGRRRRGLGADRARTRPAPPALSAAVAAFAPGASGEVSTALAAVGDVDSGCPGVAGDAAGHAGEVFEPLGLVHNGDVVVLCEQCVTLIFRFCRGHRHRELSRSTKEAVDAARPVVILGPPTLPATACYREEIGTARAGYGVWVPTHKTVSLRTMWRSVAASRRALESHRGDGDSGTSAAATSSTIRWERSATTSSLSFSKSNTGTSAIDSEVSLGFWKAALRLLHQATHAATSDGDFDASGGPGRVTSQAPAAVVAGGALRRPAATPAPVARSTVSLWLSFGNGPQLRIDQVDADFMLRVAEVELLTSSFG